MNAVVNALRAVGVDHLDMPATPARIWAAMQEAGQRRGWCKDCIELTCATPVGSRTEPTGRREHAAR